jgi:HAD superfamily hydrolase (TIGR01459 family)
MNIVQLNSIKEILDKYQYFIIDIWGVLHDGNERAFEYAIDTLKELKAQEKYSLILSNSPRNLIDVADSLAKKGIETSFYDALYTSGQEVQNQLKNPKEEFFKNLGTKVYVIGFSNLFESAGHQQVESIEEADYILATRVPENNLEASVPLLQKALSLNLPLVCANPDKVAQTFEGPSLCPGVIYDYYIENQGRAISIGKPYPQVYGSVRRIMQNAKPGLKKEQVLVIGDGLFTDIKGANQEGFDSVFISSGIHAELSKEQLSKFIDGENISPTYLLEKFS